MVGGDGDGHAGGAQGSDRRQPRLAQEVERAGQEDGHGAGRRHRRDAVGADVLEVVARQRAVLGREHGAVLVAQLLGVQLDGEAEPTRRVEDAPRLGDSLPGLVATPILIDCDPGHDDAMALLLALASPEVELLGVTTVHGNQTLDKTTANAIRVLEFVGRPDVPVAAGADAPLARERYVAFRFYPLIEHVQVLVETSQRVYPGVPLRQALRKLGRGAPNALVASTLGKVVLAAAAGVHDVIDAMAKAYPLNARPSMNVMTRVRSAWYASTCRSHISLTWAS